MNVLEGQIVFDDFGISSEAIARLYRRCELSNVTIRMELICGVVRQVYAQYSTLLAAVIDLQCERVTTRQLLNPSITESSLQCMILMPISL